MFPVQKVETLGAVGVEGLCCLKLFQYKPLCMGICAFSMCIRFGKSETNNRPHKFIVGLFSISGTIKHNSQSVTVTWQKLYQKKETVHWRHTCWWDKELNRFVQIRFIGSIKSRDNPMEVASALLYSKVFGSWRNDFKTASRHWEEKVTSRRWRMTKSSIGYIFQIKKVVRLYRV